jgi:inorganic pyrophosphatase/exopolyphosphatase
MKRSNSVGSEAEYSESEGFSISRKRTTIERESLKRKQAAQEYVNQLPPEITTSIKEYLPSQLSGALFVGHLVTDLDSVAGSIGAAELYGGIPARASEVNSETNFALKYWKAELPKPIEELLEVHPQAGVCLVDHQQTSQLNKSIDLSRIVGVIDHHALQNATIVTDMPIYIDIRPWGSMSSIITHNFLTLRRRPKRSTAGMLLCAILSDTLNLNSPTTTEWDRLMVAILVQLLEVDDVQHLCSQQFKAKSSELSGLSAKSLVTGDQKVFTYKTESFDGSVAFAVVETTDDEVILRRTPELLVALNEDKEATGVSLSYLAVVNIVKLKTTLLLCGPNERSLSVAAFPNGNFILENDYSEPFSMDLGNLVSRKKDFIPAVSAAIKKGWSNAPSGKIHTSTSDIFDFSNDQD